MPPTRAPRAIAEAAFLGAVAGLLALLLEAALAELLGSSQGAPPIAAFGVYAGLGALVSLALAGAARLFGGAGATRSRWTAPALAFAALQGPALAERAYRFADASGAGASARALSACLAVAVYLALLAGLALWLRRRPLWVPALIAGTLAALLLGVNRTLFTNPLTPYALTVDAALLALGAGVALSARKGPRAGAGCGVAALIVVALILATGPAALRNVAPARPETPHLVLVLVDTLREDVFRDVVATTPEGEAFRRAMRGSTWFGQTIATAPWTTPSVGSLMTGLYPDEHGLVRDFSLPGLAVRRLPASIPTLAQALSEAGFHTAGFITNGFLHPRSGVGRGFSEYHMLRGASGNFPALEVAERLGWIEAEVYQPAAAVRRRVERQLPWLLARNKPLFLWVHLLDPHHPLYEHPELAPAPRHSDAGGSELDRLYRLEVRYALLEVAKLVERLDAEGIGRRSLLVFASDHGEMLPSDGRQIPSKKGFNDYGHGVSLYDEQLHVPLVIRPPGAPGKDREVGILASQIDLAPTIDELLGVPIGLGNREARSLAPWIAGEPGDPGRTQVLAGAPSVEPVQRAVRSPFRKVISYPGGERPTEVYDLEADPEERNDLVEAEPERGAPAERLVERSFGALAPAPDTEVQDLDAATRRNLEALGYVE